MAFLVLFLGVRLAVTFHLPARVFEVSTLVLAEGSLVGLSLGDRAEIGMAGIRISMLKLGMGEMKLSRACI
jgi:PIN domain nuclease of toxin-antitoxin system